MPVGIVSGFNTTRVVTTADTTITAAGTVGSYIAARLAAGAAAAVLRIYNNTTAAANQVAILKAAANTADELGVPVRCQNAVKVQLSVNTGTAFIYTR